MNLLKSHHIRYVILGQKSFVSITDKKFESAQLQQKNFFQHYRLGGPPIGFLRFRRYIWRKLFDLYILLLTLLDIAMILQVDLIIELKGITTFNLSYFIGSNGIPSSIVAWHISWALPRNTF